MSRVLIVDALNLFFRAYSTSPATDINGIPVGGVIGSLLSLGSVVRMLDINKIYCVFDGKGGSSRRKSILKEYKAGRKMTIRMNRQEDFATEEEKLLNMKEQMFALSSYLEMLPIQVIIVDRVEADDVIAYINEHYHTEDDTYIMSTDKDFLQLINHNTFVYSPTKKKLYDVDSVIKEYLVHPCNMVIKRTMEGDKSDNINGVHGIGPKTIQKHLSYLINDTPLSIDEFEKKLNEVIDKPKAIKNLITSFDIIERNDKLMNLKLFNFPIDIKTRIRGCVEEPIAGLNKMKFLVKLQKDGLTHALRNDPEWLSKTFFSIH